MKQPFTTLLSSVLLTVLLPLAGHAQAPTSCSLIPNGGFETANLPVTHNGNTNIYLGPGSTDELVAWRVPNYSSPDYFYDIPGTGIGANNAPLVQHSGKSCIGLFGVATTSIGADSLPITGPNEYASLRNSISLRDGRYYAILYAARVGNSAHPGTRIGMNITPNTSGNASTPGNLKTNSQPYNYVNGIQSPNAITAAATWTPVAGLFTIGTLGGTASALYDVNIGNFSPNSTLAYYGTDGGIYYYIDDVALYRLPEAGPDITLPCNVESGRVLGDSPCSDIPGATYQWYSSTATPATYAAIFGATSSTFFANPAVTTHYKLVVNLVLADNTTNTYETTATVTVPQPLPSPILSTSFDNCQPVATYRILNYNSAYTYTLTTSNGVSSAQAGILTSSTFSVRAAGSSTGSFQLQVTAPGSCGASFTQNVSFSVTPVPVPTLSATFDNCQPTATYQITNYNPAYTYTLTNLTGVSASPAGTLTSATFSVQALAGSSGGSFQLVVTGANGCSASLTQNVSFNIAPVPVPTLSGSPDDCTKIATYQITNFNSAYYYVLLNLNNLTALQGNPVASSFQVQATAGSLTGSFQLVITSRATGCSTSITQSVTFGDGIPVLAEVERYDEAGDQCFRVAHFRITNYNPNATYTINNIIRALPNPHVLYPGTTNEFFVKGGAGTAPTGYFSITTTLCGSSVTSDPIAVDYPCNEIGVARAATTAYPNPASEALALPKGATNAVLLNSQGTVVQRPDAAGNFHVESLPAGLYNLRMEQDGKPVNQHIEVKH